MRTVHSPRRGLARYASGLMFLAFLISPAAAQSPGAEEANGGRLWQLGGCFGCHGNLADGAGDGANTAGPSLRQSRLDREGLIETISCGRVGTLMPYNLAGAYTEVACHGLPLGEPPATVTRGGSFTEEQIGTLADFLVEHVVGQSRITRENCGAFFNGNADAPLCRQY